MILIWSSQSDERRYTRTHTPAMVNTDPVIISYTVMNHKVIVQTEECKRTDLVSIFEFEAGDDLSL